VQAPEVDRQPPVDEDPHVVVTGEAEHLAARVAERGVGFEREVIVVQVDFVAEQLTVDRKEIRVRVGEEARARARLHLQRDLGS
jgi:hypothetical protein